MIDRSVSQQFAAFWALYPRKVCKIAAQKAFAKALKMAAFDAIMAGLKAYDFRPDPNFQPHAATWLRAGGWIIEKDTPAPNLAPVEIALDTPRHQPADWLLRRMAELTGSTAGPLMNARLKGNGDG